MQKLKFEIDSATTSGSQEHIHFKISGQNTQGVGSITIDAGTPFAGKYKENDVVVGVLDYEEDTQIKEPSKQIFSGIPSITDEELFEKSYFELAELVASRLKEQEESIKIPKI